MLIMPDTNPDFISKRTHDATKLFGMIEKDTKSYVILFLSILSGVFVYLYVSAKNENISLSNKLNKQIQDEIRNQLPGEVNKQVEPIRKGWDETKERIDTLVERAIQ